MDKDINNISADKRLAEITNIFATAIIRLIESSHYQENNQRIERSFTRLPSHSKHSCVRKNNKERIGED